MVRIKPDHWRTWEENSDETISTFRLDESREHYGNEEPPFTIKYTAMSIGDHVCEDGTRSVTLDLDNLKQIFGHCVKIKEPKSHISLKRYDTTLGFWTLDIGKLLVIVCSRGSQYYPWLGPREGLSPVTIIQKLTSNGGEHRQSLKKRNERQCAHPSLITNLLVIQKADSSGSLIVLLSPINFQAMKESSKPGRNRSASPELHDALSTEGDAKAEPEDEAAPALEPSTTSIQVENHAASRSSKRVRRNRGQDFGEDSSDGDYGPGSNAPKNRRTHKKPRRNRYASLTGPTVLTRSALPVEQGEDTVRMTPPPNPTLVTTHGWTSEQLSNTTFFIAVSSNDFGSCPVYLRSCQTLEEFFKNGLDAWGLEDKAKAIIAVTVKFDWLPEKRPTIVTPKIPDSYQHVLRTIETADCWLPGGSNECTIQVTFNMAA